MHTILWLFSEIPDAGKPIWTMVHLQSALVWTLTFPGVGFEISKVIFMLKQA